MRQVLWIWLWVSAVAAAAPADSLLRVLDTELGRLPEYMAVRQDSIDAARANLARVDGENADAYNVLRTLYSLYRTYDVDSALWVARRRLQVAEGLGDESKIASARLNLAESSISAGSYDAARRALDGIDRTRLADYHHRYLYDLYTRLWRQMALNDGIPSERRRYLQLTMEYADSFAIYSTGPERLNSRRLLDQAQELLDGGDRDGAVALMAEAALMDIREGRRDLESLMRLAAVLCDQGDYSRAYEYITTALEQARAANARARAAEMLEAAEVIDRAHGAMVSRSVRRLNIALWVIAALALIALVAFASAFAQMRALRRTERRLRCANDELARANRLKEQYISQLFDIYSGHARQISDLRKGALQQLRAGRLDRLERSLSSPEAETTELQEMYRRFDEMFLSMYPDFLAEYNASVAGEHHVDPASRTLTPELRVHALVSMGITDSGRIARLLHYSPQTVYNYRSRLRQRLSHAP